MQAALFRKINFEGKNYYQVYDIVKDFEVTDKFQDFSKRKDADYMYLPVSENLYSTYLNCKYLIFTGDESKKFVQITGEEFVKVFHAFNDVFHDLDEVDIDDLDEMEEQFEAITDDVYFQDEAIIEVLQTINRNWDIMESDAPCEVKRGLKDNIIVYGLPGTGKNTLINSLKNNLRVPYVDLTLSPEAQINIEMIIKDLANSANGDLSRISHGIIFVRDNFDELACINDELLDNPYLPLMTLLNSDIKITTQNDSMEPIDLRDLTFVTVVNIPSYSDFEEYLMDTEDMPNTQLIMFNELTPTEQKTILLKNKNSIINQYRNILKVSGRSLKVYESFIDDIILLAKRVGDGMRTISGIIGKIIKNEWYNAKTISLTSNKLKEIVSYIDVDNILEEKEEKKPVKVKETSSQSLEENLNQLVDIVKQTVCAQDEHVKRILYTILRNRYAANSKDLENPKRYIKNILIRGESGNGKTAILTEVARLLDMPLFVADATSYTEEGYVGNSVSDMLKSLLQSAGGDLEKAQRGILVIDEIDKKAGTGSDSNVTRGAVMDALLKIIEGTVIPLELGRGFDSKKIMFDTSRLTVICSGAFENIEKIRDSRLKTGNKKTIGFGSNNAETISNQVNKDPNIIDEDYVNYGMNKQFMARFGVIVNLNKLTIEDHKTIMKNSKTSELVIQKKLSELEGITLTYEESFYDALAQKSYDKQIGARGIERAFQDVLNSINFMDISPSDCQEVIFNGECVSDPSKIILVPREKCKILKKALN